MTTAGYALSTGKPQRSADGKYQIRIESYDPARNTMKAIWLVSRNQRLLSQLLDKCEVPNSEPSNQTLRGNLLSVQRELQELREAMDHHDGMQTPVLDATQLGMERHFDNFDDSGIGSTSSTWNSNVVTSSSSVMDDGILPERASSAFGFGQGHRRCNLLSHIPKYSRPSIRTDFCISQIEVFPWIRQKESKIPKAPPPPPPTKKKAKKTDKKSTPPRPKTSLSGRGSRLSSYGDKASLSSSGRASASILKTSIDRTRPATSMALTRTVTKRVSFEEPIKPQRKSCHSRSLSTEKKSKTKTKPNSSTKPQLTSTATRSVKTKKQTPQVRPATSLGIRSIPRSSSRLSSSLNTAAQNNSSGRRSSMDSTKTTTAMLKKSRRNSSSGSGETYAEIYRSIKAKEDLKAKTSKVSTTTAAKKTKPLAQKASVKTKTPTTTPATKKKTTVENRGVQSGQLSDKRSTKKAASTKRPLRPKSSIDVKPKSRPDVLPFESPPPAPKIHSQPIDAFLSFPESSRDGCSSPLIRSISLIDGEPDEMDPFNDVRRTLPRIRVEPDHEAEYRVKAYFLDDLEDLPPHAAQLDSGVIPSSPVEVDSSSGTACLSHPEKNSTKAAAGLDNNSSLSPISAIPEPLHVTLAECNNTSGVEKNDATTTAISTSAPTTSNVLAEEKDRNAADTSDMPSRDPLHASSTTFPEIGLDYMPEFESEVHGLLDTLMSQDMLASSFSQDLRLFSSDSNFMDASVYPTEPASQQHHCEQTQDGARNEMAVVNIDTEKNEKPSEVVDDVYVSKEPTTITATLFTEVEETAEPRLQPTETSCDRPLDSSEATAARLANELVISVEKTAGNEDGEHSCNNFAFIDDPSSVEVEENARDPPNKSGSLDDVGYGKSAYLSGDGCSVVTSVECQIVVSDDDDGIYQPSPVTTRTLRRKSTGSHESTEVAMSIAALKPRRHRRSVSQTELDALLTNNNDGRVHRTRSPGRSVEMGSVQRWSEDQTCADDVHNVDPCSYAETSSVISDSELTLPDPCQTYHDVHHGYSPSFSTSHGYDTCADSSSLKSLSYVKLMLPDVDWCFFTPVEMASFSPSSSCRSSFHRGRSFDFHSGNRSSLNDVEEVETPTERFATPSSPSLRYDSLSTARMLSTNEIEDFDQVEQCLTFDTRSSISKDGFLKSTGSMSMLGDREAKEIDSRTTPRSETDFDHRKDIVIPPPKLTMTIDNNNDATDVDMVDDSLGNISTDYGIPDQPRVAIGEILRKKRDSPNLTSLMYKSTIATNTTTTATQKVSIPTALNNHHRHASMDV